ncbi:hypothetical protein DF109_07795 [Burkholderia stagnalis]|uniref:hypothetical protein n=1 Tax=Burkholderia stagnalis TaxID=1503054 RepID=UPI000F5D2967|nr:hypothetical protein [Burkholderia stagnalis]RQY67243.1 hypothetical protein DF109_07795 [Burkholderia stagnalis]
MPRPKNMPTADELLAVMRPGIVHSPHDLSKRFNTRASDLRPVLEEMADAGALSRVDAFRARECNFRIAGTEKHVADAGKYVGVPAAPRTYFVMTGDLDSYAAEIRRRADLCMMVRR